MKFERKVQSVKKDTTLKKLMLEEWVFNDHIFLISIKIYGNIYYSVLTIKTNKQRRYLFFLFVFVFLFIVLCFTRIWWVTSSHALTLITQAKRFVPFESHWPVSKLSRGWGHDRGKDGERAGNDVSGIWIPPPVQLWLPVVWAVRCWPISVNQKI